MIPLCEPCHRLIDAKDSEVRIPARKELRRSLAQYEVAFAVSIRGIEWLDRRYPMK